jgi:hypothetical protein
MRLAQIAALVEREGGCRQVSGAEPVVARGGYLISSHPPSPSAVLPVPRLSFHLSLPTWSMKENASPAQIPLSVLISKKIGENE